MADDRELTPQEQLAQLVAIADQTVGTVREMGRMVATMYTSLCKNGVPDQHALFLTNAWMLHTLRSTS